MRRNIAAAVVQLIGLGLILIGAFMVSWEVGVIACGAVVLMLGIDLEAGDR